MKQGQEGQTREENIAPHWKLNFFNPPQRCYTSIQNKIETVVKWATWNEGAFPKYSHLRSVVVCVKKGGEEAVESVREVI